MSVKRTWQRAGMFMLIVFFGFFGSRKVHAADILAYHSQIDKGIQSVIGWSVESYSDSHYVTWTNRLEADEMMCIEWSLKKDFTLGNSYALTSTSSGEYCISDRLEKGHTYYVRAHVVKKYSGGMRYGAYSQVVTVTQNAPDLEVADFERIGNHVQMRFICASSVSGYEIQRAAAAGKYARIAKTSDNVYTDIGLSDMQAYRYRIRTFLYDEVTGLTTYGSWQYCKADAWGAQFEVKAEPTGKRSVKVSWNKVSGVNFYRIYRIEGSYTSGKVQNGIKGNYKNACLIKTLRSASARKFTDKKLKAGERYTYVVAAYRNVNTVKGSQKTYVVQDMDSVTLDYSKLELVNTKYYANGSVQVNWKRKYDASGYLIKKFNPAAGVYEKVKKLSAATTKYVFPAAAPGSSDKYLLYAYKGNVFSEGVAVTTKGYELEKPSQISAYATADGQSVQISWSSVPQASYYKVYRSRSLAAYNADSDSYDFQGAETVRIMKPSYDGATDEIHATYVVDRRLEWLDERNQTALVLNQGPQQGLVYYYYVQAFKADGSRVARSSLYSKPARAILNMPFGRPKISTVKSKGSQQLMVSWKGAAGAKKYFVYRSEKKNGSYTLVGKTSKTSFTDKDLKIGKKYYYKIKAYRPNAVGADLYSELSAAKAGTVK